MGKELTNVLVAFLAADEGVEQAELAVRWRAVESAGASAELVSLEAGEVQAFNHLDRGDVFPVDVTAAEADTARDDALVLPGAVPNPHALRTEGPNVLISSRKPDDLAAFDAAIVEALAATTR